MVLSIRLDRGRRGTSHFVCGQLDVDNFTIGRSTTLGISSDSGTLKLDARKRFELRSMASGIQLTQLCENLLPISCDSREEVQNLI